MDPGPWLGSGVEQQTLQHQEGLGSLSLFLLMAVGSSVRGPKSPGFAHREHVDLCTLQITHSSASSVTQARHSPLSPTPTPVLGEMSSAQRLGQGSVFVQNDPP